MCHLHQRAYCECCFCFCTVHGYYHGLDCCLGHEALMYWLQVSIRKDFSAIVWLKGYLAGYLGCILAQEERFALLLL